MAYSDRHHIPIYQKGVIFLLVAIIVDLLSILLTGISSIGCNIQMKRDELLTQAKVFLP